MGSVGNYTASSQFKIFRVKKIRTVVLLGNGLYLLSPHSRTVGGFEISVAFSGFVFVTAGELLPICVALMCFSARVQHLLYSVRIPNSRHGTEQHFPDSDPAICDNRVATQRKEN